MGVWGTGVFDNDDALDWCGELARHGMGAVVAALAMAERATAGEGMASHAAVRSLAAAEVVAAAIGRPIRDPLPRAVHEFLDTEPQLRAEVIEQACRAVRRCLGEESQLRQLWEDDPEWLAITEALLARLSR